MEVLVKKFFGVPAGGHHAVVDHRMEAEPEGILPVRSSWFVPRDCGPCADVPVCSDEPWTEVQGVLREYHAGSFALMP